MAAKSAASTSTTGRRRGPSKGDRKEAAILDAAWNLMTEKPLAKITIEDLARDAGISRSNFYFYFDSKEAAVRALADRVGSEHRAVASAVLGGPATTGEDLRQAIATYIARWRTRGAAVRAMDALAETDPALGQFWNQLTNEVIDETASALEAARRAGIALPAPPEAKDLVRALFDMLWRAGHNLSLRPTTAEDEERLVDTLTTVCLRAIVGFDPRTAPTPTND